MLRQFSEIEEKYGFILIDGSLKKEIDWLNGSLAMFDKNKIKYV